MMTLVDTGLFESMVAFRRDLHRLPELSWQEHRTAEQIAQFLSERGIRYRTGIAQTGVVADIIGRRESPVVALRSDMDALPIREETGLPFASKNDGVMHACGHDGHTTMLLGAADLLARDQDLPATVRLIFQPAEETGQGAKAMIDEGVLEDVAMIFGGHLDRHFPCGTIAVTDGAVNASSDRFRIEITGQGGHAARPHESVDAVVVGSLLIIAIQTIVSREVNPASPSVVSVGRFDAGTAANVIADRAVLEGSIRAQDPAVRTHLHEAVTRIAKSVGVLHGAQVDVQIDQGTPVVVNDPEMVGLARQVVTEGFGKENLRQLEISNMGGEDFGYYLQRVPGCYVRFGSLVPGKEGYPAHSSKFDFDEQALAVGARYYQRIAKIAGEQIANSR